MLDRDVFFSLQTEVSYKTVPTPIRELREYRVVDMAMGPTHTAVLVSSWRVFTFGRNMEGQLGTGLATLSSMVTKTQALQEKAMVRVYVQYSGHAPWGVSPTLNVFQHTPCVPQSQLS